MIFDLQGPVPAGSRKEDPAVVLSPYCSRKPRLCVVIVFTSGSSARDPEGTEYQFHCIAPAFAKPFVMCCTFLVTK